MDYFRSYWSHLGHIDDHMPAPDGSCGIRNHDSWILRPGPHSLRHRCGNYKNKIEMAYFRSYWSHLDISKTICPHQMAAVGFETMTLGI